MEIPLETIAAAARIGARNGAIVILNPAPARPLPIELLRCVSILTPNESEAELLTGIRLNSVGSAAKAARKLHRRGIQAVVLTLSARGALIVDKNGTQLIPGFNVKAVDTTGAGDTFNGAFAVALTEGKTLDQAVRFANAAAAISVTRLGAQPSIPTRQTIERFFRSHG